MSGIPVLLDVTDRRVVIVGAGAVAYRRIRRFLDAGATVEVIAPQASDEVVALADKQAIVWRRRRFVDGDLDDAWLVATATGTDADLDVFNAANSRRIWCINSADAARGSAQSMAQSTRSDGITVAVHGGNDPKRAVSIRDAIAFLLQTEQLPTRRHRRSETGKVTLVGAGPGDPELVTLRALHAISNADVLVVDRLAPSVLWDEPAEGVEVIDVGKQPGKHAASQEEINQILVDRALAGKQVARIKGGDPFVLGRGGEEALACIKAGVDVEIVPGITSAVSVPASAGIPVTQRGITSTFIVASSHEGAAGVLAAATQAPPSTTLVLLMGASKLPAICQGLIDSGRPADLPVAVVESGWTTNQKCTVTTLGEAASGAIAVHPPAVTVIGEVVAMREVLGDLGHPSDSSRHASQ